MLVFEEYNPECPSFCREIVIAPLPNGFKLPRIEPYDGFTDPDEHLKNFYVHMTLYAASDAIFCRAFPCTLKGPALRWFFSLPPNSISNFKQLTEKFLVRFLSSKISRKLPETLTSLKQGEDEALEDYFERFNQAVKKVDDLSSRRYMLLIEAGLRPGSFKESLVKKPAPDLEDLWSRAVRFVDERDKPCNKRQRGDDEGKALN